MAKIPVILNHDAAIDEYMSTMLLTTMEEVELLGIVITNADCIAVPAMTAQWKIQSFIGRQDIPLSLSKSLGYNPFPWDYRGDCIKETDLSILDLYGPNPDWPPFPDGDEHMARMLDEAQEDSVTMLITCPMTTLADVLMADPSRAGKIQRMIWMGGAYRVGGNLNSDPSIPGYIPIANPYAEWNAFWDPFAVDWIFNNTRFPIVVFPLDITNQAAITKSFMASLLDQGKRYRYSNLAYQSYEIVSSESFYDMWDVVTTCYVTRPEFFKGPEPKRLEIVTDFVNQGALRSSRSGRQADVVLDFADQQGFYDYVLKQFRR